MRARPRLGAAALYGPLGLPARGQMEGAGEIIEIGLLRGLLHGDCAFVTHHSPAPAVTSMKITATSHIAVIAANRPSAACTHPATHSALSTST